MLEALGDGSLLLEIRSHDPREDPVERPLVHAAAVVAELGEHSLLELEAHAATERRVGAQLEHGFAGADLLGEIDAELRLHEVRALLRARDGGQREGCADVDVGLHGGEGLGRVGARRTGGARTGARATGPAQRDRNPR